MKIQKFGIALALLNLALLLLSVFQTTRVAANSVAPVLRGRAMEVVDEHGRVRAQLTVEPSNNEAVFRLRDAKGTIRVKLGGSEDGSALLLLNEATEPGVHVLSKSTGVSLTLKNRNGTQRTITPQ